MLDVRDDFPFFAGTGAVGAADATDAADASAGNRSKPPVYLDNAATTQKPKTVLDAIETYYRTANANSGRGIYALTNWTNTLYASAREAVARFVGAKSADEVVFTSGCTDSLNQIAQMLSPQLKAGDEIALSVAEHHSNLLPWQRIARLTGAKLVFLSLGEDGRIPKDEVGSKIGSRTKIVAVAHASNVLGLVNDVEYIVGVAHAAGAQVVLDCAQTVAHLPLRLAELDVDFAAFSGHKVYAPMGIGVLYGKACALADLEPARLGGGMVGVVEEDSATWAAAPARFEAGTCNVAGAIGLAQALGYLDSLGWEAIRKHESELTRELRRAVEACGGRLYAPFDEEYSCGIVPFNVGRIHSDDVARRLSAHGVCIRAGNHCAQPLMRYLGVTGVCRASVGIMNTPDDVRVFETALANSITEIGLYISGAVM